MVFLQSKTFRINFTLPIVFIFIALTPICANAGLDALYVGQEADIGDEVEDGGIRFFFNAQDVSYFVEIGKDLPEVGAEISDEYAQRWIERASQADFSRMERPTDSNVIPVLGAAAGNLPIYISKGIDFVPDVDGPNLYCPGIESTNRCRIVVIPANYFPAIAKTSRGEGVVYVGATQRQIIDNRVAGVPRIYGEKKTEKLAALLEESGITQVSADLGQQEQARDPNSTSGAIKALEPGVGSGRPAVMPAVERRDAPTTEDPVHAVSI